MQPGLGGADPLASVVEAQTAPGLGVYAAADPVRRFEEREVDAVVVQLERRGETRVAAADDDDLGLDPVHFGLFPHDRRACRNTDHSVNIAIGDVRNP